LLCVPSYWFPLRTYRNYKSPGQNRGTSTKFHEFSYEACVTTKIVNTVVSLHLRELCKKYMFNRKLDCVNAILLLVTTIHIYQDN
jgi:hypothetical protein